MRYPMIATPTVEAFIDAIEEMVAEGYPLGGSGRTSLADAIPQIRAHYDKMSNMKYVAILDDRRTWGVSDEYLIRSDMMLVNSLDQMIRYLRAKRS